MYADKVCCDGQWRAMLRADGIASHILYKNRSNMPMPRYRINIIKRWSAVKIRFERSFADWADWEVLKVGRLFNWASQFRFSPANGAPITLTLALMSSLLLLVEAFGFGALHTGSS